MNKKINQKKPFHHNIFITSLNRLTWLTFFILFTIPYYVLSQTTNFIIKWQNIEVSTANFREEYSLYITQSPDRDTPQTRRAYAFRMLERAIIGEWSKRNGLDQSKRIQTYLNRKTSFAFRQRWLETAIRDTIPFPDTAILRDAFAKSRTFLHLQQIFGRSKHEIDSLYALIQSGGDFNALARASMRKYGVSDTEKAGDMGWVKWNDLDIAPEAMAYRLRPLETSAPVASLNGWHIFRLIERREELVLDETSFEQSREKLAFDWRNRRYAEAASQHIKQILFAHKLEINLRELDKLWGFLAPYAERLKTPEGLVVVQQEVPILSSPNLNPRAILATVSGKPFRISDFLAALPDVPSNYWKRDLRQALEIAIRDAILTTEAKRHLSPQDPYVQTQKAFALYTARYYTTLSAVSDTLRLSRYERAFYEQFKSTYFREADLTQVEAWAFPDSMAAWKALRRTLAEKSLLPLEEVHAQTFWLQDQEIPTWPLNTLRITNDWTGIQGPYPHKGQFWVIRAKNRASQFRKFEDIQAELPSLMQAQKRLIAHMAALPKTYNPQMALLNETVIDALWPYTQ